MAVLDGSHASSVVIPGGNFLLTAEFHRVGSDLVLEGKGGHEVVVIGFFSNHPPELISESGGVIPADLAIRLAGPIFPGGFAQAGGGGALNAIGVVDKIAGTVTVHHADGTTAQLAKGGTVYQGDVLETGDNSSIGIIFADRTVFALGANGRMVMDELVYDPQAHTGHSAFSVVQGTFSFVSGQIAKSGPDNMTVKTPVMTIGIRGTTVEGQANAEGQNNSVSLVNDPDGGVGQIVISTSAGTEVLTIPNQTVQTNSAFQPPPPPVVLTQQQIESTYGTSIINFRPTPPSSDPNIPGEQHGSNEPNGGTLPGTDPTHETVGSTTAEFTPPPPPPAPPAPGTTGNNASTTGTGGTGGTTGGPNTTPIINPIINHNTGVVVSVTNTPSGELVASPTSVATLDLTGVTDPVTAALSATGGSIVLQSNSTDHHLITDQLSGQFSVIDLNNAGDVIIVGSTPVTLNGGSGPDLFYAGHANATIFGGGGSDTYSLQDITDAATITLDPGINGSAILTGGAGTFTEMLSGIDVIVGGAGNLAVNSGTDALTLYAGAGATTLHAGGGAVTFVGSSGDAVVTGGAGSELVFGGSGGITVTGGSGNTIFEGGTGNATVTGTTGAETVYAGVGSNIVHGGSGANFYYGEGVNSSVGTYGDATVTGGAGSSEVFGSHGAITFLGSTGGDIFESGGGNASVYGGSGTESFFGGAGHNIFHAGSGTDLMEGGDGANVFYGGGGTDTASFGSSGGTYFGGSGHSTVDAGYGGLTVIGGSGGVEVNAYYGNEDIAGGSGGATVSFADTYTTVTVNMLAGGDLFGEATVDGGAYTDILQHVGVVEGGNYSNLFYVGSSSVTFIGGTGTNEYVAGNASATFNGGAGGTNEISLLDISGPATVNLVNGTETHNGFTDTLVGTFSTIYGSENGGSLIIAGSHDLTYVSEDGTDTVTTGTGASVIMGDGYVSVGYSSGTEEIALGSGSATVYGGTGTTNLFAGNGTESFIGGSGNNVFIASSGGEAVDVFQGSGSNNTASFGEVEDNLTVNLNTSTEQAIYGSATVDLSDVQVIDGNQDADAAFHVGSSAVTINAGVGSYDTFYAGQANATFDGADSNQSTLDLSGLSSVAVIALLAGGGTETHNGFTDTLTDIGVFVGDTFAVSFNDDTGGHTYISGGGEDDLTNLSANSDLFEFTAGSQLLNLVGLSGGGNDTVALTGSFDLTATQLNDLANISGVSALMLADATAANNDTLQLGSGLTLVTYIDASQQEATLNLNLTHDSADFTFVGGSGTETITGGNGDDTYYGGSGSESITGGDATNTFFAGSGIESIYGGAGSAEFFASSYIGTEGTDSFAGGTSGLNQLSFADIGEGNATVDMATGLATYDGEYSISFSNIQIFDGSGNGDTFDIGASAVTINGGNSDTYFVGAADATIFAGGSQDTLDLSSLHMAATVNLTSDGNDEIHGAITDIFSGISVFVGTSDGVTFNDMVGGNTYISGGDGDSISNAPDDGVDTLVFSTGDQIVNAVGIAGSGSDVLILTGAYELSSAALTAVSGIATIVLEDTNSSDQNLLQLGANQASVSVIDAGGQTQGYPYDNVDSSTLTIDASADTTALTIYAGSGIDTVTGGSGGTTFYANEFPSEGTDSFDGGTGGGTLSFANSYENLTLDLGNNAAYYDDGGAAIDYTNVTSFQGYAYPSEDNSTLDLSNIVHIVTADLLTGTVVFGATTDTVSDFDIVQGNATGVIFTANNDGDTYYSGGGADTIHGGSGDDYFVFSSGAALAASTIVGGSGFETLEIEGSPGLVSGDLAHVSGIESVFLIDTGVSDHNTLVLGSGMTSVSSIDAIPDDGTLVINAAADAAALAIYAGPGTETITGGSGGNYFSLGNGTETVFGGAGNDTFSAGSGTEFLTGGSGANTFFAGAGLETITGGGGPNTFYAASFLSSESAPDVFTGVGSHNTLSFFDGDGPVTADLRTGVAVYEYGGSTVDFSDMQVVAGSDNYDSTYYVGSSAATIIGHGYYNTYYAGNAAADIVGTGYDTLNLSLVSVPATVNLAAGIETHGGITDTISGIEVVVGTTAGDVFTAGGGFETYISGGGADTLHAVSDDFLEFLSGAALAASTINGGAGNNTLELYGSFDLGTADLANLGGIGTLIIDDPVSADHDTLVLGGGLTAVTSVVLEGNATTMLDASGLGGTLVFNVYGEHDTVLGGSGTNTFIGGEGGGVFVGGGGTNIFEANGAGLTMQGGSGINIYELGYVYGHVAVNGTGSDNVLSFANDGGLTSVNLNTGTATFNYGYGTVTLNDVQVINGGSGGDDYIAGAAGYTINGGPGHNTLDLSATSGHDTINLDVGYDVHGGVTDTLSGIEVVKGNAAGDVFTAGAEGATFVSGGGADTLSGGSGMDVFEFSSVAALSSSTIIGGSGGHDAIALSGSFDLQASAFANDSNIGTLILSDTNGDDSDTLVLGDGASSASLVDASGVSTSLDLVVSTSALTVLGGTGHTTLSFGNGDGAATIDLLSNDQAVYDGHTVLFTSIADLDGGGSDVLDLALATSATLYTAGHSIVIDGTTIDYSNFAAVDDPGTFSNFSTATQGVTVNLSSHTESGLAPDMAVVGPGDTVTIANADGATGSGYNDIFYSDHGLETINGGGGVDTLALVGSFDLTSANVAFSGITVLQDLDSHAPDSNSIVLGSWAETSTAPLEFIADLSGNTSGLYVDASSTVVTQHLVIETGAGAATIVGENATSGLTAVEPGTGAVAVDGGSAHLVLDYDAQWGGTAGLGADFGGITANFGTSTVAGLGVDEIAKFTGGDSATVDAVVPGSGHLDIIGTGWGDTLIGNGSTSIWMHPGGISSGGEGATISDAIVDYDEIERHSTAVDITASFSMSGSTLDASVAQIDGENVTLGIDLITQVQGFVGSEGNDTFLFETPSALLALPFLSGGGGDDTLVLTSNGSVYVDADFANITAISDLSVAADVSTFTLTGGSDLANSGISTIDLTSFGGEASTFNLQGYSGDLTLIAGTQELDFTGPTTGLSALTVIENTGDESITLGATTTLDFAPNFGATSALGTDTGDGIIVNLSGSSDVSAEFGGFGPFDLQNAAIAKLIDDGGDVSTDFLSGSGRLDIIGTGLGDTVLGNGSGSLYFHPGVISDIGSTIDAAVVDYDQLNGGSVTVDLYHAGTTDVAFQYDSDANLLGSDFLLDPVALIGSSSNDDFLLEQTGILGVSGFTIDGGGEDKIEVMAGATFAAGDLAYISGIQTLQWDQNAGTVDFAPTSLAALESSGLQTFLIDDTNGSDSYTINLSGITDSTTTPLDLTFFGGAGTDVLEGAAGDVYNTLEAGNGVNTIYGNPAPIDGAYDVIAGSTMTPVNIHNFQSLDLVDFGDQDVSVSSGGTFVDVTSEASAASLTLGSAVTGEWNFSAGTLEVEEGSAGAGIMTADLIGYGGSITDANFLFDNLTFENSGEGTATAELGTASVSTLLFSGNDVISAESIGVAEWNDPSSGNFENVSDMLGGGTLWLTGTDPNATAHFSIANGQITDGSATISGFTGFDATGLSLGSATGIDITVAATDTTGYTLAGSASGSDTITGGAGNDTIVWLNPLYTHDTLDGGQGDNTLVLDGLASVAPTIDLSAGANELISGNGSVIKDFAVAEAGEMQLNSFASGLYIYASSTDTTSHTIIGSDYGTDTLQGGGGINLIYGGGGSGDTLIGGTGPSAVNTFVLDNGSGAEFQGGTPHDDTIMDFNPSKDTIALPSWTFGISGAITLGTNLFYGRLSASTGGILLSDSLGGPAVSGNNSAAFILVGDPQNAHNTEIWYTGNDSHLSAAGSAPYQVATIVGVDEANFHASNITTTAAIIHQHVAHAV